MEVQVLSDPLRFVCYLLTLLCIMIRYFAFAVLARSNRIHAAVIQLVECDLAKVDVVGSNPIRRFLDAYFRRYCLYEDTRFLVF